MMSILISTLLVFVTAVKNGHSVPTSTVKPEKPLFLPSISNPTTVHSTIYGTGRLESSAHYTPYGHNPAFYEFSDLLQRQPSYPPFERVLQHFLHHRGENRKVPESAYLNDEDDYKRKANNLLSSEQLSPELEDLDRKYKRSTTYISWNSPNGKMNTANLEGNRASTFNSRAVNGLPFGPYTTWSPYQGPLITSYVGPKKSNAGRQRRHDIESDGDDGENRDEMQSLIQYAPAYNMYTMFPSQLEPHHIRFVRDMPLQYPVVYETAYPDARKTSDNLALLTNSLAVNAAPIAHADELDKFPSTY